MRLTLLLLLCSGCGFFALAQSNYFPPQTGNAWETTDPADLGWCTDSLPALYDWLEETNTKGFLVLKDGRIVLEQYFGSFTQDSVWYWASAGKGLTALLVGIAQEEGALDIYDPTSDYLGNGWTDCTPAQEDSITLWHQLTMTTGMNEAIFNCTLRACLNCITDAGTRWAYHNGPYRLLRNVVENATDQSYNTFTFERVLQPTGMFGFWSITVNQTLFISRARDMARYGLLIANQGRWNGTPVIQDTAYVRDMLTPSQTLNRSYGYLWWLNGQSSHRLPATLQEFPGPIAPAAPADLVAAMGANGQFLGIVPSQQLVVVRMGEAAGEEYVPSSYHNDMWRELNKVFCPATTEVTIASPKPDLHAFPNPVRGGQLQLTGAAAGEIEQLRLYGLNGPLLRSVADTHQLDLSGLPPGIYWLTARLRGGTIWRDRIVIPY